MRKETIKIVAIGDGTVGKTCILVRYRDDSFPKNYIPTIVENYPKELKLPGIVV
jgi:GTPase SAR1 family protein